MPEFVGREIELPGSPATPITSDSNGLHVVCECLRAFGWPAAYVDGAPRPLAAIVTLVAIEQTMVVLEEAQEPIELRTVDADGQRLGRLAEELVRGQDADEEAGDVLAVPGVVRVGDHRDPIGVRAWTLLHLFAAGDLEQ